jgi:transcriptional regulator with XRE-family HTH domain
MHYMALCFTSQVSFHKNKEVVNMPGKTIESLGPLVKTKRGNKKLRETAKEIGIGPATLMRVESGHTPDLHTFGKICKWLDIDPGEFLGFKGEKSSPQDMPLVLSAHFRAERASDPKTIEALAQMISLAVKMQATSTEVPNG